MRCYIVGSYKGQCDRLCVINGKETTLMSVLKVCECLVNYEHDIYVLSSVRLDWL
jgi:hypothetical protein